MPRETTLNKVHEDHSNLFKVVSSRLLNSHMRVQTSITRRPSQLLIVFVADVTTSSGVFVSLRQTKVNDVDYVLVVALAYQEIVRLDVSV